ncbi:MAG: benzoyl-CoA reductase subunit A [Polyangiaceae bacterium]|nr:benzoyl-CoA reductase subunit A [Polyangiaceae bacterium]
MKCVVGIDLGSTTTKAVLLDERGSVLGQGITNSRSNYAVASSVARDEALTAARFTMLERAFESDQRMGSVETQTLLERLAACFRLEVYLAQLEQLGRVMELLLAGDQYGRHRSETEAPARDILAECIRDAPQLFVPGARRKSDFFRDLAGAAFMAGAERRAREGQVVFERIVALFDRAIFDVETWLMNVEFATLLSRALDRALPDVITDSVRSDVRDEIKAIVDRVATVPIEECSYVGTGYGRQTLPFPKEAVRSEILCHGRGAHRVFPGTRSVLDIGGQDTKALQVDDSGMVTAFQMNDRCAAGCGRYLGYIADELNIGLHELGPLALQSTKVVKINSTCTVFAGAELRERLSLGQRREDILAALHRSILTRAMSLIARSGGIRNEFTFTGGVCKNPMATKVLGELVAEHYGSDIVIHTHPDSIYMGALGAALFALDDLQAGRARLMLAQEKGIAS